MLHPVTCIAAEFTIFHLLRESALFRFQCEREGKDSVISMCSNIYAMHL